MKNNKLTLSELRNVIKEEVKFQLTKKNLVESLDSKTLKRILKEAAVSKITYTMNLNPSIAEPFRIVNPNPNDKVTTIVSKNPSLEGKTFMKVNFIYTLQASGYAPEYGAFKAARDSNPLKFFSTDKSSLIIANHIETIKNTNQNANLSYTLDLVIEHSPNISFNLNGVKGQKVTQ
jgi:hypothetical protein